MPYLFATQDEDYTDLASGHVLYNLPGAPAFPVRLASEIFQRVLSHRSAPGPVTLYDPTCGGAYHLAALGFLHGEQIRSILVSDIDPRMVDLARRNLDLLSLPGLGRREAEISELYRQYGKESHAGALISIHHLRERLAAFPPIQTRAFQSDALNAAALSKALSTQPIDLVLSDIPYGQLSEWNADPGKDIPPLWQMLDALHPILNKAALVAIAADKRQKIEHPAYQRVERFQVGKRQVAILQPRA